MAPVHIEPFMLSPSGLTRTAITDLVTDLANKTDIWESLLRYSAEERWFALLDRTPTYDAWLLSWSPGQSTELHDHGGSSGAFRVLVGTLHETVVTAAGKTRDLHRDAGQTVSFGPKYIHDVAHPGTGQPAASLHVYSPPLTTMNYYTAADGPLRRTRTEITETPEPGWAAHPETVLA